MLAQCVRVRVGKSPLELVEGVGLSVSFAVEASVQRGPATRSFTFSLANDVPFPLFLQRETDSTKGLTTAELIAGMTILREIEITDSDERGFESTGARTSETFFSVKTEDM